MLLSMKEAQNQRARESELRCQTTAAGGASPGSSRWFRLDPTALPRRYIARFDEDGRRREATIYLDRDQAIIKCRTSIGAPLTVCLPVSAFEGVAVRMSPVSEDGDIEVVVELRHRDPALCLPLMAADDPADVADDWKAWGEVLGLPLLLVDQEGSVVVVDGGSALAALPPQPRRRHSFFAERRPRFLTRRKRGLPDRQERLSGHEIIARD
jgi:hypothetical protein